MPKIIRTFIVGVEQLKRSTIYVEAANAEAALELAAEAYERGEAEYDYGDEEPEFVIQDVEEEQCD